VCSAIRTAGARWAGMLVIQNVVTLLEAGTAFFDANKKSQAHLAFVAKLKKWVTDAALKTSKKEEDIYQFLGDRFMPTAPALWNKCTVQPEWSATNWLMDQAPFDDFFDSDPSFYTQLKSAGVLLHDSAVVLDSPSRPGGPYRVNIPEFNRGAKVNVPPQVTVMHGLIHAARYAAGVGYVWDNALTQVDATDVDLFKALVAKYKLNVEQTVLDGLTLDKFRTALEDATYASTDEVHTVLTKGYDMGTDGRFTENVFRAEIGLPLRAAY